MILKKKPYPMVVSCSGLMEMKLGTEWVSFSPLPLVGANFTARSFCVNLQLRRETNGFMIVELVIVNDFRQVMSLHQCICQSLCLSVCQSACLSVCLSVYLSRCILMVLNPIQYQRHSSNITRTVQRALEVTNFVDNVSRYYCRLIPRLFMKPGNEAIL